jgi:hypothetical protein
MQISEEVGYYYREQREELECIHQQSCSQANHMRTPEVLILNIGVMLS